PAPGPGPYAPGAKTLPHQQRLMRHHVQALVEEHRQGHAHLVGVVDGLVLLLDDQRARPHQPVELLDHPHPPPGAVAPLDHEPLGPRYGTASVEWMSIGSFTGRAAEATCSRRSPSG